MSDDRRWSCTSGSDDRGRHRDGVEVSEEGADAEDIKCGMSRSVLFAN